VNISRRVAVSFLVGAMVLFIGLLFWPFILNNIIKPIALVVWLLLRILVLSVDQKYFWYAMVFVTVFFLFRFLPREQPVIQSDVSLETNATIKKIGYWRILFTYNDQNVRDEKTLKRELIYLLTSFYASKQSTSNHLGIYEALQQGEIPLPENIHTFLFSLEPQESGGRIKKFFQSIRKTLQKWIRQWTGQEKAEHYRMIDEVLNLMETLLEIKHDDRKFMQIEH
jgi:hypothetical protein